MNIYTSYQFILDLSKEVLLTCLHVKGLQNCRRSNFSRLHFLRFYVVNCCPLLQSSRSALGLNRLIISLLKGLIKLIDVLCFDTFMASSNTLSLLYGTKQLPVFVRYGPTATGSRCCHTSVVHHIISSRHTVGTILNKTKPSYVYNQFRNNTSGL